ncbi:MAG: WG repeat-containing protein [Nostoc sp.]
MDKVGNFIIPLQFDFAANFSEGLALVSIGNQAIYRVLQPKL